MSTGIGLARGSAMYLGAVLGPGVLALPGLGAAVAGPASIVVWLALLVASAPVAATFAALAARYPDGGGIATFVRHAAGAPVGMVVGWWFYAAVPFAVLAGALIAARYAATLLGTGTLTSASVVAGVLLSVFALNLAGVRLSGQVQLGLSALLVAILVTAIAVSAPHVQAEHLHPFLPHGLVSLPRAACLLYVGLTGWEAATHLSAVFSRPRRDLPLATAVTWCTVAALYLGLAVTTVGVLGPSAARSAVPLAALLEHGLGPVTAPATAGAALLLTVGACTTFTTGAAQLGAALGRDRAMPAWLAHCHRGVPRRSLAVQAVTTAVLGALYRLTGLQLSQLLQIFSALLAVVAVAGCTAAVRLLPGRTARCCAATATLLTTLVAASAGVLLAVPALVALTAMTWRHLTAARSQTAPAAAMPRPAPIRRSIARPVAIFPPAGLERIDAALLAPA